MTRGAEADQNHFLGREFKPLQRGGTRGVAPEGWLQRGGTRGVASAQIPAPGPLVDTTKFWSTTGIDLHQNYQSYIT